jgi:AcrR family transcriptional regulator
VRSQQFADPAETRLLDAAEELFYERGVQAVPMDELRARAGLPLKRIYALVGGKDELVRRVLERRDVAWRERLARFVAAESDPRRRLLAVFDWLHGWFGEPGFRGCAWINTFGELGGTSPAVAAEARRHKDAVRTWLAGLVADAGEPGWLTDALLLLMEGAMTTAAISGSADPALQARDAARRLLATG